jgi:predicted O-linked N-acetylglucosamine transferase (SPINDLY family)
MKSIDKSLYLVADLLKSGNNKEALNQCIKILRKKSSDYDALMLFIHASLNCGKIVEASEAANRMTKLHPKKVDGWNLLGRCHLLLGNPKSASHAEKMALAISAKHPQAWFHLGLAEKMLGNLEEAFNAFSRAHELDPNNVSMRYNYSLALIESGAPQVAEEICRNALDSDKSGNPKIMHALGMSLIMLNNKSEAEKVLFSAQIKSPNDAELACDLGSCQVLNGAIDQGLKTLYKSIKLNSELTRPRKNLILALLEAHQPEKALEEIKKLSLLPNQISYEEQRATIAGQILKEKRKDIAKLFIDAALDEAPLDNDLLVLKAKLLYISLEFSKASKILNSILESHPENLRALLTKRQVLQATGCLHEAEDLARNIESRLEYRIADLSSSMFLTMIASDRHSNETLAKEHFSWGLDTENNAIRSKLIPRDLSVKRKLKIGYISPDFRKHSVAYFLESHLQHLDKSEFEIYCYSNNQFDDEITERFKNLSDYWRVIKHLTDKQAAMFINQDRIDILVDLAGHTDGQRLSLFAMKPAPVQVTWLGYPSTTGLKTIDYRFCDEITDPPGSEDQFSSEELYRLPNGFLCYEGKYIQLKRAVNNSGNIIFGSFNNFYKITEKTISLWSKLLGKLPNSKLLIKARALEDTGVQELIVSRFLGQGISPDRLELHGWIKDTEEHLNLYNKVDIGLDTFPYNGTTTTCEALWMGVPVLTIHGGRHAARVGASILVHAGLSELVAKDDDDFIEHAIRLASKPELLHEYHTELRERILASKLCDASGFTRQMEAAFQEIWQRYVDTNISNRQA